MLPPEKAVFLLASYSVPKWRIFTIYGKNVCIFPRLFNYVELFFKSHRMRKQIFLPLHTVYLVFRRKCAWKVGKTGEKQKWETGKTKSLFCQIVYCGVNYYFFSFCEQYSETNLSETNMVKKPVYGCMVFEIFVICNIFVL